MPDLYVDPLTSIVGGLVTLRLLFKRVHGFQETTTGTEGAVFWHVVTQLASNFRLSHRGVRKAGGMSYDVPAIQSQNRWGNVEIWAWLLGFYGAILLIGFPIAVPLFVIAYNKFYGARWVTASPSSSEASSTASSNTFYMSPGPSPYSFDPQHADLVVLDFRAERGRGPVRSQE